MTNGIRSTRRVAPSPRKLAAAVDRWNKSNKIGALVSYTKDDGRFLTTRTRSDASILSGHAAVIWLDGVSGCVALERVQALP